jgi:hypothetical protein
MLRRINHSRGEDTVSFSRCFFWRCQRKAMRQSVKIDEDLSVTNESNAVESNCYPLAMMKPLTLFNLSRMELIMNSTFYTTCSLTSR